MKTTREHPPMNTNQVNARKAITRSTRKAAERSMAAHIQRMKVKGWQVQTEFGGDKGLGYECITWFFK